MGTSKTRLGLSATPRGRYGSFAGKTAEVGGGFQPAWAMGANLVINGISTI